MASGKVDVRVNSKTSNARFRFYDVKPVEQELILLALDTVKKEYGTTHDSVALAALCTSYLQFSSKKNPGDS